MTLLEKPTRLDRAEGDVHPGGNPHIQTDPRNIGRVAGPLAARLAELDPANAAYYQARYKAFAERWKRRSRTGKSRRRRCKGTPIVVQHKAFTYLEDWLGLKEVAALEPKPGVEPTTAHLTGSAGNAAAAAGEDGDPRRLPERPRVAVDRRAREDQRRDAAVHRRRRRRRRRISTACSTTRSRGC